MFGNTPPAGPPERHGDDRTVRPARPVWVDLARVFPRSGPMRPFPPGWNLQDQVPGDLHLWGRTTTGEWAALVRFRIRRGDGSEGMIHTQWVPAHAVTQRDDTPTRGTHRRDPPYST